MRGPHQDVLALCGYSGCGRQFTRRIYLLEHPAAHGYNYHYCSATCFQSAKWCSPRSLAVNCLHCRKPMIRQRWQTTRRKGRVFCSKTCFHRWRSLHLSGPDSPNWKGGVCHHYLGSWRKTRESCRARDGHRCRCCARSRLPGERAFDVHHVIDYEQFSDPREANRLGNLVTLCRQCHAMFNANCKKPRPGFLSLAALRKRVSAIDEG